MNSDSAGLRRSVCLELDEGERLAGKGEPQLQRGRIDEQGRDQRDAGDDQSRRRRQEVGRRRGGKEGKGGGDDRPGAVVKRDAQAEARPKQMPADDRAGGEGGQGGEGGAVDPQRADQQRPGRRD